MYREIAWGSKGGKKREKRGKNSRNVITLLQHRPHETAHRAGGVRDVSELESKELFDTSAEW